MAKTIKFNLICDNKPIRTIDDLQDNFCIEDIFDYYENGLLLKWLKVRGYDKQAEEVSKIGEEESEKIISKLIEIFEIEKTDRELINEIFKVRIARGQKRSGDTRILYEDIAKYYKTDFESLMKNLIDKNTSIDIVKNNISQLIKNYGWVFQIGAKKIFYDLLDAKSYFPIIYLLTYEEARKYYLEGIPVSAKAATTQDELERYEMYEKLQQVSKNTVIDKRIREGSIFSSGDMSGIYGTKVWKHIRDAGKKYMILSIKEGDAIRNVNDKDSWGLNYYKVCGKFPILDGFDYWCSNVANSVQYMEVQD